MKSLILGGLLASTLVLAAAREEEPEAPPGPAVGQSAPSFRLNDHEGNAVAVGGERDQWTVLAFYPKARTPG